MIVTNTKPALPNVALGAGALFGGVLGYVLSTHTLKTGDGSSTKRIVVQVLGTIAFSTLFSFILHFGAWRYIEFAGFNSSEAASKSSSFPVQDYKVGKRGPSVNLGLPGEDRSIYVSMVDFQVLSRSVSKRRHCIQLKSREDNGLVQVVFLNIVDQRNPKPIIREC
jgi:hypothetical protein